MPLQRTFVVLSLVFALAPGAWAQDAVTEAAKRFVAGDGFAPEALEQIETILDKLIAPGTNSMVSAGVDISPIEKAFLILDAEEMPLLRSRYLLRYNQRKFHAVTASFVEIERYNLGPAIRQDTIAAYGAENTAGPEAFGIGPHVAWRFALRPTAKSAALLLAASRREVPEAEAATRDCLPRTCLSLEPLDNATAWSDGTAREVPIKTVGYPALAPSQLDPGTMEIVPAYQALELGITAGLATADVDGVTWSMPEHQGGDSASPFLIVLVDRNLGQDVFSDAALGLGKLGMDSQEQWTRIGSASFEGGLAETLSHATGPLAMPH